MACIIPKNLDISAYAVGTEALGQWSSPRNRRVSI